MASAQKTWPATEAASATARSGAPRRSRRAAISASIVGGALDPGEVARRDPDPLSPLEQPAVVGEHPRRSPRRRAGCPATPRPGDREQIGFGAAPPAAPSARRPLSAAPSGARRRQAWSCAAQRVRRSKSSGRARTSRRIGAPCACPDEVLDQVEQGLLRPVEVVEHDVRADLRSASASKSARIEPRRAPRSETSAVGEPDGRRRSPGRGRPPRCPASSRCELRRAPRRRVSGVVEPAAAVADDLGDRPEGDALAVVTGSDQCRTASRVVDARPGTR